MAKKSGRPMKQHGITLKLDSELYEFFSEYADRERTTMAGILRTYVLSLLKKAEEQPPSSHEFSTP